MAGRRRNHYREAAPTSDDVHPIDTEVDRRVRRTPSRKQIIAAQQRVMQALGDERRYMAPGEGAEPVAGEARGRERNRDFGQLRAFVGTVPRR
jgi:hypothetical protein